MKKFLFVVGVIFFSNVSIANINIGYISVENVLSNSQSFNEQQTLLQNKFKKEEEILASRLDALRNLVSEYNEAKDELSSDEKKTRVARITSQEKALKEEALKIRQSLEQSQAAVLREYQDKINVAIKKFAQDNDYQLILYKDIAYASDSINITDEISKMIAQ